MTLIPGKPLMSSSQPCLVCCVLRNRNLMICERKQGTLLQLHFPLLLFSQYLSHDIILPTKQHQDKLQMSEERDKQRRRKAIMSNNNQDPSHDESLSNLPAGGTDVSLGEGQKGNILPTPLSIICIILSSSVHLLSMALFLSPFFVSPSSLSTSPPPSSYLLTQQQVF